MLLTSNIVRTDSYKVTHWRQYPLGMSYMQDHLTSRGGKHPFVQFFGLQAILHLLAEPITLADINEAEELFAAHFGNTTYFNREGWLHILNAWGGRLPLRIRAVPEGRLYPVNVPLFTVESLDPKVYWLVSWVEAVLQKVWYPTTVATEDFFTKIEMFKRLSRSAENPMAGLSFMLHDFGYRGASSEETAMIGGGAALVNFMGTDTLPALLWLKRFYMAAMAGFSVAASEHSTTTTWGRFGEPMMFENMIEQFKDDNIISVVIDSYDDVNAVRDLLLGSLRDRVMSMKAKLVLRPDSGDPVEKVAQIARIVDETVGSTVNAKGYKVLNKVGILQGDGINHDGAIGRILDNLLDNGFSAENVVFGMGGGRLQMMNRDTQKFAIKCNLAMIDGEYREVFKDPITDSGKKSLKGGVDTLDGFFGPYAVQGLTEAHPRSMMRTVFNAGCVGNSETFDKIRERANNEFLAFTGAGL